MAGHTRPRGNGARWQVAAGRLFTIRWLRTRRMLNLGGKMPRDGAIILGDIELKLPVLKVTCIKCPRQGRYIVKRLIRAHGRNAKVIDWVDVITADCPKRIANNTNDQCGVRCPELPKVL